MSAKAMKELREAAKLTQREMADLMGIGMTTYQDLEADDGFKRFKHRHLLALERVSEKLAVERGNIDLALPSVRRDAQDLARLISGEGQAYVVTASFMGRAEVKGFSTAKAAVRGSQDLFDRGASNVAITDGKRAYSMDQLRGAIQNGEVT